MEEARGIEPRASFSPVIQSGTACRRVPNPVILSGGSEAAGVEGSLPAPFPLPPYRAREPIGSHGASSIGSDSYAASSSAVRYFLSTTTW